MKLQGWCQWCQRVRLVSVRNVSRTMPVGICEECEKAITAPVPVTPTE